MSEEVNVPVEEIKSEAGEIVDKLKKENPEDDIYLVLIGGKEIIFRGMNREMYSKYLENLDNITEQTEVEDLICSMCVLYPSQEEFNSLKKKKGGLAKGVSEEVFRVSGFVPLMPAVQL